MRLQEQAFEEGFKRADSPWFEYRNRGESSIKSDKGLVTLVLPKGAMASPNQAPQLQTPFLCGYGYYAARLRTADNNGQDLLGAVTGLFTYFNDGRQDTGGIGVPDNSEIDFEWLSARPEEIIMSVWSKYRDSDGVQCRVSRMVNLRTGRIIWTRIFSNFGYDQSTPLPQEYAQPVLIPSWPDYDPSRRFYTYGFIWKPDHVSWWIENPANGKTVVLWDYRARDGTIPVIPAQFMANIWHTPVWTPEGLPAAVEPPRAPVTIDIEWMRFKPHQ